jgi:uncharacterized protein with ParB-like and HNH nuclease domain
MTINGCKTIIEGGRLVMESKVVTLHEILSPTLQMIVPIFQREYSWQKDQIETLWDDIIKIYNSTVENDKTTHFLGSIVRLETSPIATGTTKFYLIDGQQRIITLMILLACIGNVSKNDDNLVGEIEYLLNSKNKEESEFKLVPSKSDEEDFRKIIQGIYKEKVDGLSSLKVPFNFFTNKLTENLEFFIDHRRLKEIVINNLIIVSIDIDKDENPYLIFESLNAKGTPLTQADLIRNYIFMKIDDEGKQKELYKKYWYPMETLKKIRIPSGSDGLDEFFRTYSCREGKFVKIKRTYADLKDELKLDTEKSVEKELEELHQYSEYFSKLVDPEKEPKEKLKSMFIRHNRWEIGTVYYPFLLNIYKDYKENIISLNHFCDILEIIEAFVIRRFFCRWSSNELNKPFIIDLYKKLDKNNTNIIKSLKENITKYCPTDIEFKEGLKKFPIYKSGAEKTKLILETFESDFNHKEKVDYKKLQIEHIMPQSSNDPEKLPPEWRKMLGDYNKVHNNYLHTLGNLTLTGYDQELATKPFNEKKQYFMKSHLELNKYFDNIAKWNEEEIIKRAEKLSEIAITTWKYIGIIDNPDPDLFNPPPIKDELF